MVQAAEQRLDGVGRIGEGFVGAEVAPHASTPRLNGKAIAKRVALLAFVAAVAVTGTKVGYDSYVFEETDDAQIDADIVSVSPRIGGTVAQVLVKTNQVVEAGEVLAVLDTTDLQVSLTQAKAVLAQAEALLKAEDPTLAIAETSNGAVIATAGSEVAGASAELAAMAASRKRRQAQLTQAEAAKKLAASELARAERLFASNATAGADLDQKTAAYDSANATYDAAKHDVAAAEESMRELRARITAAKSRQSEVQENAPRQIEIKRAMIEVRKSNVEVARAQLQQAELNLQYARIVAPIRGIIGRKSITIGDRVQPGQQLLAVTPLDDVWVTANFRETQLRMMHPSQRVTVHVDAIARDFVGSVESMPGATGSRYSLLPPENATGNYVKVVQRMPVRIKLDPGQPEMDRLRPGMSVEPRVRVR